MWHQDLVWKINFHERKLKKFHATLKFMYSRCETRLKATKRKWIETWELWKDSPRNVVRIVKISWECVRAFAFHFACLTMKQMTSCRFISTGVFYSKGRNYLFNAMCVNKRCIKSYGFLTLLNNERELIIVYLGIYCISKLRPGRVSHFHKDVIKQKLREKIWV